MKAGLFAGIDGGQSSTEAVISYRDGKVLGRGLGGPCNHVSGPEAIARFENAINGAMQAALTDAGLAYDAIIETVCLGLSGGPEDKSEHIRRILKARRYKITHDAEIAHWGALGGAPGVIVIAGTGSIAYGRDGEGRSARAGGWGHLFGDEGGAWDVARRAVRACLAMEEGWGPATTLREHLVTEAGCGSADQMMHAFYTPAFPRQRVALLSKLVDSAAISGDAVAREILAQAGRELARYGNAVKAMLFPDAWTLVSCIGGVFESSGIKQAFSEHIEGELKAPERCPAEGALLRAISLS